MEFHSNQDSKPNIEIYSTVFETLSVSAFICTIRYFVSKSDFFLKYDILYIDV